MSYAMSRTHGKEPHNSKKRLNDLNLDKNEPTSKKLLKFAGTWKGDDFKVCLEAVYKTRGVIASGGKKPFRERVS